MANDLPDLKSQSLQHCSSFKTDGSDDGPLSPIRRRLQNALDFTSQHDRFSMLPENSQLQMHWDQAMCDELGLPEGYARVSVLLVKWRDEIDQLKTLDELMSLETIFRESFGFHTKIFDLSECCTCSDYTCACTPQERLDRRISKFLTKWDSRHTLSIIYYTGHGTHNHVLEPGFLKLHPHEDSDVGPCLIWEEIEENFITKTKGDVLVIMDTCFAGSVHTPIPGENARTYEYLAACAWNRTTESPGEHSFTAALINSLRDLRNQWNGQGFTTQHLHEAIEKQKSRRNNLPRLLNRSTEGGRHIVLAPINHEPESQHAYFEDLAIPTHLTLRIELKEKSLNKDQVEDLSRQVARAVRQSSVDTRRVDWLHLTPRKAKLKNFARLAFMSTLMRKRRNSIIGAVSSDTEIQEPGFFAGFGFVSQRMRLHVATIALPHPWPRLLGVMLATGALGLFLSRSTYGSKGIMTILGLLKGWTYQTG